MVGPRSRNLWVIWLSFALALLLSVAPMPAFMETGRPLWLALKSGNFGSVDFFEKALRYLDGKTA